MPFGFSKLNDCPHRNSGLCLAFRYVMGGVLCPLNGAIPCIGGMRFGFSTLNSCPQRKFLWFSDMSWVESSVLLTVPRRVPGGCASGFPNLTSSLGSGRKSLLIL